MLREKITQACIGSAMSLLKVAHEGLNEPLIYYFDCGKLQDFNHEDIRNHESYKNDFIELGAIKNPILYYFEIVSDNSGKEIRESISKYKSIEGSKSTPALKKSHNEDSRILYVGKVKKAFWGRLIQHLGFYKVKQTQGLQLFYWGKPIGLKVKLFVYLFPMEMAGYMEIIEREIAKELQPIVGMH